MEIILDSVNRLAEYSHTNDYHGYDPYDALKSPLFNLPILRTNKFIRFGFQQFVKRFPINLRPLLAIPRGYNPVTLGLFIQGYSYLAQLSLMPDAQRLTPLTFEECLVRIKHLVNELKILIPAGYNGACWGYDFPWEARYASIPAYQPTAVATGIIINALYTAYTITGNEECAELVKSSAHFVLEDLNKTYSRDSFIFSYSPFDNQQVLNASMKGVRILAQAYSLIRDENLKSLAKKAVQFVVSHQRNNGSWCYSLASRGEWTDNYHTGYILECLHDYNLLCEDHEFEQSLTSGYEFYINNFIGKDGIPKFYHNRSWPVDCTAAAQSILTLTRFGDVEKAKKVAEFTIDNMQSSSGGFYYRKYKHYTNKTRFMRWSNAWMFVALSYLITKSTNRNSQSGII